MQIATLSCTFDLHEEIIGLENHFQSFREWSFYTGFTEGVWVLPAEAEGLFSNTPSYLQLTESELFACCTQPNQSGPIAGAGAKVMTKKGIHWWN